MNPLNASDVEAFRREIVELASALMKEDLPFLEGVRQLASARFGTLDAEKDPDLLLFAGVASQLDHIPASAVRSLCADVWLDECDREIEDVATFYAQDVKAACERLIKKFSGIDL